MALPLTVAMIVRNEEQLLPRALESVRDVATEIVVVDTGSEDSTLTIARDAGAKVAEVAWEDDFAKARNTALEMATQPWILVLDADESLSGEAKEALQRLWPRLDERSVYSFPLLVQGQGTWNYKHFLFANDPNLRYAGRVHEEIVPLASGYRQEMIDDVVVDHWNLQREDGRVEAKSHYYAQLLNRRLEETPDDPTPHLYLARYHLNVHEYPEALARAEEAIAAFPDNSNFRLMAHLYAALAHYHMQAWAEVVNQARQGLQLYAKYSELHALVGLAELELGHLTNAETALTSAVVLSRQPNEAAIMAIASLRPPALYEPLTRVYKALGHGMPENLFRKLLKAKPEEVPPLLCRELAGMLNRKEWSEAIWLVSLLFPVQLADRGKSLRQRLTQADPVERLLAESELWSCMQALGEHPPQVERLLRKASRDFPADARAWQRLGRLALDRQDWAQAAEHLERAVGLHAQSGWAWNALGIAHAMGGNPQRARVCFGQAIEIGTPQDVQGAKQNLARLLDGVPN